MFNLKTSTSELSSMNHGTSRAQYEQIAPSRDVTLNNFSNGNIHFRFETSGSKWFLPSKTYMRVRCRLNKTVNGNPTQLSVSDNIAPNMGLCGSLFQSAEFRLADKTVSRISDFLPQIDALENRVYKSKSWLDGIGRSTNFWDPNFTSRQNDVVSNPSVSYSEVRTGRLGLGYDPAVTVAIAADTGVLTFSAGDATPLFQAGDYIEIEAGGAVGTLRYYVSAVTSGTTLQLNKTKQVDLGAAVVPFTRIRVVAQPSESRSLTDFELNWQPPLSIFKVDTAIPCCKGELVLNPQTSATFQKAAIESLGADKVAGVDFNFSIVDMYLIIKTVEGPRADSLTYLLDLNQVRCQTDIVNTNSLQQRSFDISPSTYALAVAYQDQRLSSTLYSASKFRSYDGGLVPQELSLTRLFVNFAGQNKPQPDADPSFVAGTDNTLQRYVETQMETGGYEDTGSAESLLDFHNRGSFYFWNWARDGTDRSTRCTINHQFSGTVDNTRVLLFDLSKQVARVSVQDGRIISCDLEDM